MATRFLVPFGRGIGDPVLSLHREMNRLFDDMLGGAVGRQGGQQSALMAMPSLDVREKGDELDISVDLPGLNSNDVDVRLDRDVLTISGERKSEQDQQQSNYHVMERSYGRFSRSLQLPFMPDANQVSAEFTQGVLKIRLKRSAEHETSKRIEVQSKDAQGQIGQESGNQSSSAQPSSSGSNGSEAAIARQNGTGQGGSSSSAGTSGG